MSASRADDVVTGDRRIHAQYGDEQVVRYDRAGKWYIEFDPPMGRSARHVTVREAANRAVQLCDLGGEVRLGIPGGGSFDREVNCG